MYYPEAMATFSMMVWRLLLRVVRYIRMSNTERRQAFRSWNDRRNDDMHTRRLRLRICQQEYQQAEQARQEEIAQLNAILALPDYGSPVHEQQTRLPTNSEIFDELFPPREPF